MNLPSTLLKWASIFLLSSSIAACGGGGSESSSDSAPDPTPVADTIPPVITLSGPNELDVSYGEQYVEQGATAIDNIDGNVEVTISGEVDTSALGEYTLTYTATDRAGNSATANRMVTIVDNVAPIIELNGEQSVSVIIDHDYFEQGAVAEDNVDGAIEVTISGEVNTRRLGEYQVTYSASDLSNNTSSISRTVAVVLGPDVTPPMITLNGDTKQSISISSEYVEQGATALDDRDGNVEVEITGQVVSGVMGEYIVTYSASDSAGNTASQIRTVTIVDDLGPVISLNGGASVSVAIFSQYAELGASAFDETDGAVLVSISGTVDTAVLGTYIITYSAADGRGNVSSVNRIVKIVDVAPPVISLIGDSEISLFVGEDYVELGATALDVVDGEVVVSISGNVDTSQPGNYQVNYVAVDASGNEANEARTVIVKDGDAPVITLKGDAIVSINENEDYVEQGATAIDAIDGELEVTITGNVDNTLVGEYLVTYQAIDQAGNEANKTRQVLVLDITPPVITLNGESSITILDTEEYTELGATADDNVDGEIAVVVEGTVDASKVGVYTITYSAVDSANNSASVEREVTVVDGTAPVITLNGEDEVTVFQGEEYEEEGAVATDNVDGELAVVITGEVQSFNLGTYTLTYSATDEAGNTGTEQRTVIVKERRPFITTWDTTGEGGSEDNQIKILSSGASYTIDWGDGSSETINGNEAIHTYDTAGVYTISINSSGGLQLYMSGTNQDLTFISDNYKLRTVEQWGDITWGGVSSMFFYTNGLVINATDAPDLSAVTDMSSMFSRASNFNSDISHWDTSNIQSMSSLFANTDTFNIDISAWDTSSVTDMSWMFSNATAFNQSLDAWNVSNVTTMAYMFSGATEFNSSIAQWDVSSLDNSSGMFQNTTSFNVDISGWNTSSVTDMSWMFRNAAAFNQPIGAWDVSNVVNMYYMFAEANGFEQEIGMWDVSKVQDMSLMFLDNKSFNQDISGWNVSSVQSMSRMFSGTIFNKDIGSWDVSNVENMSSMFSFSVFNRDISGWDVSKVTDMSNMFDANSKFAQDIGDWDVASVQNMSSLFSGAHAFNHDISNWDVSNVQLMRFMFSNATTFNQDISSWNVSNVTAMFGMFRLALAFDQDIGQWNIGNVQEFDDFLESAKLSSNNYNSLLVGWSSQQVQNDLSFDAGNSVYTDVSAAARQNLVDQFNWTITDGGQAGL